MTRLIAGLALVGLLALPAEALQKRASNLQDRSGRAILSATVTVYVYGTTTKPTIYSDNGITPKSNPVTVSTSDGSYSYYVANGRYTETVTASGFTFTSDQSTDIVIFDYADVLAPIVTEQQ